MKKRSFHIWSNDAFVYVQKLDRETGLILEVTRERVEVVLLNLMLAGAGPVPTKEIEHARGAETGGPARHAAE